MDGTREMLSAEIGTLVHRTKTSLMDKQSSTETVSHALSDVICLLPKSKAVSTSSTLQTHIAEARDIFVREYYQNFTELLADAFSANWLEAHDNDQRLVELFNKCFLLASDDDAFLAITRVIATKNLSVCVLHCTELLEVMLKKSCLARIFETFSCRKCVVREQDLLRDPQCQSLVNAIASLPDVIAGKAKSPETGDFYLPQNYIPFLCSELVSVLHTVYDQIRSERSVSVIFMSALVGKLSVTGFAELLWRNVLDRLEAKCLNDFLWRRIMQRIIGGIPDRCLEPVVVQLVMQASSYIALQSVFGTLPLTSAKVTYILTHKMILIRCYNGRKAVRVLQNIVGYLMRTDELSAILCSAVRALLGVWADANSLKHRPVEQSLYLSKAVVAFISFSSRDVITDLRSDIQQHLLGGLPGYLESSVPSVRQMGSFVAEKLSGIIHRENEGEPLCFGLERTDVIESLMEFCELPAIEVSNNVEVDDNCHEACHKSSPKIDENELLKEDSVKSSNAAPSKMPAISLDSDDDDDDDDDESFAEFKPYPMAATQPENAKRPLYLAQCVEGLVKPEDPESVEQCLLNMESLIQHADPKTIYEIGVELCRVLLHLGDQYALPNFTVLRLQAMISVTVVCPGPVAEYLGQQFYARNYNIQQRMDILDVLASAASKLSEPLRSSASAPIDTETNLGVVATSGGGESPHWSEIVQQRTEAKTRRFAKGRTHPMPATSVNRFAPVAGSFFYPLLQHFGSQTDASLDLLGTDHLLLERLYYALGAIVLAAANAPCARRLSSTLMEFVRCGRHHKEAGVRQAVLYATCTAFAALPPGAVLSDPAALNEMGDWLRCVCEHDVDTECRKRAAHALLLLTSSVRKEFDSASST